MIPLLILTALLLVGTIKTTKIPRPTKKQLLAGIGTILVAATATTTYVIMQTGGGPDCTLSNCGPAGQVVGDTEFINTTQAYISAYPRSLSGSGDVYVDFQSKLNNVTVNAAFCFNNSVLSPSSISTFDPHNTSVPRTYTCQGNFNFTISPKHFWCYDTNGTLVFDHSFLVGNQTTKTATWNDTVLENWTLLSGGFSQTSINFDGKNTCFYRTNIPLVAGKTYNTKIHIDMPSIPIAYMRDELYPGFDGKYGIAFWPSSYGLNYTGAIANNVFFYLDPETRLVQQAMTGYAAPTPYSVSTNCSAFAAGLEGWRAFDNVLHGDGNSGSGDVQCNNAPGWWLSFDLGSGNTSAITAVNWSMTGYNGSRDFDIVGFKVEASNDNTSWSNITWINTSGYTATENPREFNWSNAVAYRWYRFSMMSYANNNASGSGLIGEIMLIRGATNSTISWTQNVSNQTGKTYYSKILFLQLNVTNGSGCLLSNYTSNDSNWPITNNGVVNATGPNRSLSGLFTVSFTANSDCGTSISQYVNISITNNSITVSSLQSNITSNHNSTPYIIFTDFNATNSSPSCQVLNYSINTTNLFFTTTGPNVSLNLSSSTSFIGSALDQTPTKLLATFAGRLINTATLTNSPIINSSGAFGNGLTLKGDSGNYVLTNFSLNLTVPYIYCNYATRTGINTSQAEILAGTNGGNGIRFNIDANNRSTVAMYNSTGSVVGAATFSGAGATNANNYNYYCFAWNTTSIITCVGSTCSAGSNYSGAPDTKYVLRPGFGQGTNYGLNGSLDEIRLWQNPGLVFNVSSLQTIIAKEQNSSYPILANYLVLSLSFELNNVTAGGVLNNTADTNYLINGSISGEAAYNFGDNNNTMRVSIGNRAAFPAQNISHRAFTVIGDVKRFDNVSNSEASLLGDQRFNANCAGGYTNGCGGWQVAINPSSMTLGFIIANTTSPGLPASCTYTWSLGNNLNFHEYAVTHNGTYGTTAIGYRDGVQLNAPTLSGTGCAGNWTTSTDNDYGSPDSTTILAIGDSIQHSGPGLNGSISHVQFFINRVLNPWEINYSNATRQYNDGGLLVVQGGNISATGVYYANITASDNCSNIVSWGPTLSWLNITNTAPACTPLANVSDYNATQITPQPICTDADNDPITYSINDTSRFSLNSTGGFSYLYNQSGFYSYFYNATDSVSSATFPWTVNISEIGGSAVLCPGIGSLKFDVNLSGVNRTTNITTQSILALNTSNCTFNLTSTLPILVNWTAQVNATSVNYTLQLSSSFATINLTTSPQKICSGTNSQCLVNATMYINNSSIQIKYVYRLTLRSIKG